MMASRSTNQTTSCRMPESTKYIEQHTPSSGRDEHEQQLRVVERVVLLVPVVEHGLHDRLVERLLHLHAVARVHVDRRVLVLLRRLGAVRAAHFSRRRGSCCL